MTIYRIALVLLVAFLAGCGKSETTEVKVTVDEGKPAPPKKTLRETLESSLRKHYAPYAFDTFACPDSSEDLKSVTCTIRAKNGASVTLDATATARLTNGGWKSWDWVPKVEARMITAEELADKIRDGVMAEVKKAHRKATAELDCGTSPVLFVKNKATCKLTIKNPDMVREIEIDDSKGSFDWSADAF